MNRGAWTVVALLVLAGGCRREAGSDHGVPGADPAAEAAAARLIGHERLAALLPAAAAGWSASPARSATVMLPAPASNATMTYSHGQGRIDLEITDTGGDPAFVGALATVAGTTFSQKATNGYMKGTRVREYPAVESWNEADHIGDITVLVSQRFVVHATGLNLDGIDTLRDAIGRVDLGAVAALQ